MACNVVDGKLTLISGLRSVRFWRRRLLGRRVALDNRVALDWSDGAVSISLLFLALFDRISAVPTSLDLERRMSRPSLPLCEVQQPHTGIYSRL